MDLVILIPKLMEYGTFPALLVLTALVAMLIRKLDKNAAADAVRAAEFNKALSEHRQETEKRFAEHAERFASIERDYLPRETHYKDIGGWRTDMNDLRNNLGEEIRGVRTDMTALIPSIIKIAMKKGEE